MPSHLSTIGFEVKTQQDFRDLAIQAAKSAETVAAEPGEYRVWQGSGGEELWIQLNEERRIIGMNPHFSGESRFRVRLQERVVREEDTPLDAAFHAWAYPADWEEGPEEGAFPFVFDSPDAGTYPQLQLPGIAEVQIVAFAHHLEHFESPEAFDASQEREVKLGSRSFIPSGLFSPGGERTGPPQAMAIFTGHVIKAAELRNSLTGLKYYWALVDTYGGQLDVVIDPSLLPAGGPVEGGVLSGTFWLSGRLLSYPQKKQGWLSKLFS